MKKTRSYDHTVEIAAGEEAVWRAISEGEEIKRWFAPDARTDPRPGGSIWVSWGPGMEGEAKIQSFDPPRLLSFEFGANPETKLPLMVEYHLEGSGGRTKLRLVHSGFATGADWDEEFDSHARGWAIFERNLVHCLVRHPGVPAVQASFGSRYGLSREAAWKRIFGSKGLDRDNTLRSPGPGESFRTVTAAGEVLEGRADLYTPARDFAAMLPSLNDALLRISLESSDRDGAAGTMVFGTVIGFGPAREAATALAQKLGAQLDAACAG